MPKSFLLIVNFFIIICPVFGQYNITGKVIDANTKNPLVAANVFLKSDFSKGTQTDADGTFKLNSIFQHDTLLITYIGYQEKYFPVIGDKKEQAIELKPFIFETATVVVKGEKAIAREFAASTIQKLDIYLNPNSKADPLLAVDALPASTGIEETANISLRGSSPAETGIFLNNVPLNDAVRLDQANGVGQFSVFNTAMIENLQVFPSNPPVEFGNATSGVVALYTEENTAQNSNSVVATMAGGGLYFSRELPLNASLTFYGNYSSHHGLVGLNKKALRDIEGFTSGDAGLYFVKQFSEKTLLKFFNYTLLENYQFKLRLPSVQDAFNQKKRRNQSVINLIHKLPNGQLGWNQGINFSKGDYVLGNIETHVKEFDYFSSFNWQQRFGSGSLKAGASWMSVRQVVEGKAPIYFHALSKEHPFVPYQTEDWIHVPELFAYSKRHFGEKWVVGVGTRWHGHFFGREKYWSGQGNLFYKIKKGQRFIFSFGKYNKFLTPSSELEETILLSSNQVALDFQFEKENWFGTAAIYGKKNKSAILPENKIIGYEIYLRWTKGNIKTSISLASVQSTLKSESIEYPSPHDLGYYLRAQLKWNLPKWFEFNAIYKHRQGRYYLPITGRSYHQPTDTHIPEYANLDDGQRLSDYCLLDVSFSRMFSLGNGVFIAFLSVNNVLDFKNLRGYEYNRDYSENKANYFSRRVLFFGGVYQWQ